MPRRRVLGRPSSLGWGAPKEVTPVTVRGSDAPGVGGYDGGYASTPCFWGRRPGSLLPAAVDAMDTPRASVVLDLGCGEGKNSAYVAERLPTSTIRAVDVSPAALANARDAWPEAARIRWEHGDALEVLHETRDGSADLVICYGLAHCLKSVDKIWELIREVGRSTSIGGVVVFVAFNDRSQDLARAHPGFRPTLVSHERYCESLVRAGFDLLHESDTDLLERHPNNNVEHHHSMTRILGIRA